MRATRSLIPNLQLPWWCYMYKEKERTIDLIETPTSRGKFVKWFREKAWISSQISNWKTPLVRFAKLVCACGCKEVIGLKLETNESRKNTYWLITVRWCWTKDIQMNSDISCTSVKLRYQETIWRLTIDGWQSQIINGLATYLQLKFFPLSSHTWIGSSWIYHCPIQKVLFFIERHHNKKWNLK